MTLALGLFLAFVFFSFFNTAIQWYTHTESYPLQQYVGPHEYRAYGQAYEQRLVVALYIPYFLMMLANAGLFFTRPADVDLVWLVVSFLLNLSIMLVSLLVAVPVHKQHGKAGFVTPEGVKRLLQINALRLGASLLSSSIVLGLLVGQLTA